jgi:hypothetical protein
LRFAIGTSSSDAADASESKCPSGATLADRETIATLECEPLGVSNVHRKDSLEVKNSRCRIIATSDQQFGKRQFIQDDSAN